MKMFLAIDFGTTQTSVALLREHSAYQPYVIPIRDGGIASEAVPTAVQLDKRGNVIYFGAEALKHAAESPELTFQNFKVFIGRNDSVYQTMTEQTTYSPGDLALRFLIKLRENIEEYALNGASLGSIPELTCVIGFPSEWNELQKAAIKKIARSAGFPNVRLCYEPIGAIYYNYHFGGLDLSSSRNILVYDFGGGTSDVAIASVKLSPEGKIEPSIISVGGIPDLGGRDFDEAIADDYIKENGYNLGALSTKDRLHDLQLIMLHSKSAKETLSKRSPLDKTMPRLKVIHSTNPKKLSLSTKKFEKICGHLMGRFTDPIYDALGSAGLSEDDIDTVILAGGSSSMPFVCSKAAEMFGRKKIIMSPSVEVIAQGLAMFGKVDVLGANAGTSENTTSAEQNLIEETLTDTNDKPQPQTEKKKRKWLWAAKGATGATMGAAGAYAGAAAGSVVPVVGTAIGAAAGAAIGSGIGMFCGMFFKD